MRRQKARCASVGFLLQGFEPPTQHAPHRSDSRAGLPRGVLVPGILNMPGIASYVNALNNIKRTTILTYWHDSAYNLPKSVKPPVVSPHIARCLARARSVFRACVMPEPKARSAAASATRTPFMFPGNHGRIRRVMPPIGAEIAKVAHENRGLPFSEESG